MSRRLLLIEDEADIREVASTALELLGGFAVSTAGSGEAGIEAATADPPDAILLDVMMPGIDGPETLRRLRTSAATASVPVVFLTASVQSADVAALRGLDCTGVIAKPFDPLTIVDQVREVLGWSV